VEIELPGVTPPLCGVSHSYIRVGALVGAVAAAFTSKKSRVRVPASIGSV
jgi:hypothetical protein